VTWAIYALFIFHNSHVYSHNHRQLRGFYGAIKPSNCRLVDLTVLYFITQAAALYVSQMTRLLRKLKKNRNRTAA